MFNKERFHNELAMRLGDERIVKDKRILISVEESDDPIVMLKVEDGEDIRIYMMTWQELIDIDRQRLTYMSDALKVKEQDANDYFQKNYPELVDFKSKTKLTLQKMDKGKDKNKE